jgi:uncharacterized protein YxeA
MKQWWVAQIALFLLGVTIALCFAYKAKLEKANQYIEHLEKGRK